MDRPFVRKVLALGDFNRVDVTQQVSHRDIGRCQLLGVAVSSPKPDDFRVVALTGNHIATTLADWGERVIIYFTILNGRNLIIQ